MSGCTRQISHPRAWWPRDGRPSQHVRFQSMQQPEIGIKWGRPAFRYQKRRDRGHGESCCLLLLLLPPPRDTSLSGTGAESSTTGSCPPVLCLRPHGSCQNSAWTLALLQGRRCGNCTDRIALGQWAVQILQLHVRRLALHSAAPQHRNHAGKGQCVHCNPLHFSILGEKLSVAGRNAPAKSNDAGFCILCLRKPHAPFSERAEVIARMSCSRPEKLHLSSFALVISAQASADVKWLPS